MTFVFILLTALTHFRQKNIVFQLSCVLPAHMYFFYLRRICSVCCQLGRDATAELVTALVLSRLDHCNAVLAGLPVTTLAPLQRVLHAAGRTVLF